MMPTTTSAAGNNAKHQKQCLNMILTKCLKNNSIFIRIIMATGCTCTGKNNIYGEGSECKFYSGYDDDWYTGRWCYANIDTCPDAKAHPASASQNVPGYGASKVACATGKYTNIS